ncbi:MAG: aminotransferase class I/II-fold pyridoxal phosphate-dependent enzyme [Firmicutes bacterium]|nr:aminotransferase class I/II-fold pyridoxal phosphate-dependent enzyme [Bacillota bacterium]
MHSWHSETASARTAKTDPEAEWPRPETQPIYQTSVFTFTDVDDVMEYYASRPAGRYLYSRNGNPNVTAVEDAVATLEGAEAACFSASGMGAISAAVMAMCQAGDNVLVSQDIYGGTLVFLRQVLASYQVKVTLADFTDLASVAAILAESTVRLLIAESLTNPLMRVPDIGRLADLAHSRGAVLLIDNTFATPLAVHPLALGADLVAHSATKYMGGHSDVSGGVVCGSLSQIDRVRAVITAVGSNLSPSDAWLIARGLKTLPLRFAKQCTNATQLASFFAAHPAVHATWHPSLTSHPEHAHAKATLQGYYGAIVTIQLADDIAVVNRFMRALPEIPFAPSLAGVTTSLSHPWTTSHRGFSEDERRAFGISEGLVRVSVGIEHIDDLLQEFGRGLAACQV